MDQLIDLFIDLLSYLCVVFRPHIKDIFQSIAAKANNEPCCDWVLFSCFC